jgi:acetyltransferase-like isoleucine patch superfamily enzyme
VNDAQGPGGVDNAIAWLRVEAPALVDEVLRLREVTSALDRYYRERWQRHVSAGDAIIDRWERARILGFGKRSSAYDTALVIGDVKVGHDTWIGPNSVLDGSGGLTIGDWCSISSGVQIYSHDSVMRSLTGGDAAITHARTEVGSNTYVGPNAIISKGVTVGTRCVVGAASLVLHNIPDGSVARGTPARVVGTYEEYVAAHQLPVDHEAEDA